MQALDDEGDDKIEQVTKRGLLAPSIFVLGYLRSRSQEINDHDISLNGLWATKKKKY